MRTLHQSCLGITVGGHVGQDLELASLALLQLLFREDWILSLSGPARRPAPELLDFRRWLHLDPAGGHLLELLRGG